MRSSLQWQQKDYNQLLYVYASLREQIATFGRPVRNPKVAGNADDLLNEAATYWEAIQNINYKVHYKLPLPHEQLVINQKQQLLTSRYIRTDDQIRELQEKIAALEQSQEEYTEENANQLATELEELKNNLIYLFAEYKELFNVTSKRKPLADENPLYYKSELEAAAALTSLAADRDLAYEEHVIRIWWDFQRVCVLLANSAKLRAYYDQSSKNHLSLRYQVDKEKAYFYFVKNVGQTTYY